MSKPGFAPPVAPAAPLRARRGGTSYSRETAFPSRHTHVAPKTKGRIQRHRWWRALWPRTYSTTRSYNDAPTSTAPHATRRCRRPRPVPPAPYGTVTDTSSHHHLTCSPSPDSPCSLRGSTGHHTHRRALSLHSPSNIGLTEPPVRFHRLYWSHNITKHTPRVFMAPTRPQWCPGAPAG